MICLCNLCPFLSVRINFNLDSNSLISFQFQEKDESQVKPRLKSIYTDGKWTLVDDYQRSIKSSK